MQNLIKIIDRYLGYILIFLMASMVLNVLWQVITRFIFINPSTFTDELARYLLIWLSLLGASYVSGKQRHLAIDYFQNKFSERKRKTMQVTIQFIVLFFALLVMVIGGGNLVSHTFYLNQISAALQINLGFVYLVLPISGLIIIFYSVVNILEIKKKGLK